MIALITDLGLKSHFMASMKGVILMSDPSIRIFDVTHLIERHNILEASYVLADSLPYWPADTIFVVFVDPGEGISRIPLYASTRTGHRILCPDNGLLTLVDKEYGLVDVREISDEHRLNDHEGFFTFYGRDVYAYNAGRLRNGIVDPAELGPEKKDPVMRINVPSKINQEKKIVGVNTRVESPFGNLRRKVPANRFQFNSERN